MRGRPAGPGHEQESAHTPPLPWPSTNTRRTRAPGDRQLRSDNASQSTHEWVGGCKKPSKARLYH
eukprot:4360515-Prymnesium_polylepis.1